MEWMPIETAPRDGTWFLAVRAQDGVESFEIGHYEPMFWDNYEEVENGLFRKVRQPISEWANFNNFHRMTHWCALPPPPVDGV